MESTIKPSWLAMTEQRLHSHMTKRGYPNDIIKATIDKAREVKEARRKLRIKASTHKHLWDDVLRAARVELGIVRTIKSQAKLMLQEDFGHPDTQAKLDAMTYYEAVIAKTIERLREAQKAGEYTPQQLHKHINLELRAAAKPELGGTGGHWTDFVTAKSRITVESAFNKIPDPARGKKKVPFERRISREEHARLKEALWATLTKETSRVEQELDMAADPFTKEELQETLLKLQRCAFVLDTLPKTHPIPATWHGLLNL